MEERFRDNSDEEHVDSGTASYESKTPPTSQQYGPPTMSCTCGYRGHVLYKHDGLKWWMIPIALTIVGGALLILIGNRSVAICPSCFGRDFKPWGGTPTPGADRLQLAAKASDVRAVERCRRQVLGIAIVSLGVVIAISKLNS